MTAAQKNQFILKHFKKECKIILQDVLKQPTKKTPRRKRTYKRKPPFGVTLKQENATRLRHSCYVCFQKFSSSELLELHKIEHGVEEEEEEPEVVEPKKEEVVEEAKEDAVENVVAIEDEVLAKNEEEPPLTISTNFKCSSCKVFFTNQEDVRNHVHNQYVCKYYCLYCRRNFNTKGAFIVHILQHGSMKISFACEKCPCTFSDCVLLKKHYVNRHGLIKPTLTKIQTVESFPRLEPNPAPEQPPPAPEEVKNDDPDNPITGSIPIYDCDVCYDVFASESALVRHKILHLQQHMVKKSNVIVLDEDVVVQKRDNYKPGGDVEAHFSMAPVKPAGQRPLTKIASKSSRPRLPKAGASGGPSKLLFQPRIIAPGPRGGGIPNLSNTVPLQPPPSFSVPGGNTNKQPLQAQPVYAAPGGSGIPNRSKTVPLQPPPPFSAPGMNTNTLPLQAQPVYSGPGGSGLTTTQPILSGASAPGGSGLPGVTRIIRPPATTSQSQKGNLEIPPPLMQSGNMCYKIVHPPSTSGSNPLLSGGQSFILNSPHAQKRYYFLMPNGEIQSSPAGEVQLAPPLLPIKPEGRSLLKKATQEQGGSMVMPIITNITTVVEEPAPEKTKMTPYSEEFARFLESGYHQDKPAYPKLLPKLPQLRPEIINVDESPPVQEGPGADTDPLAVAPLTPDPNRPKIFVKKWTDLAGTQETFKCQYCNITLDSWDEYGEHLLDKHSKYACRFTKCYVFNSSAARTCHMNDMHKCRNCQMVFRSLQLHIVPDDCALFKRGHS